MTAIKAVFSDQIPDEFKAQLLADVDGLMQAGTVLKDDGATTVVKIAVAENNYIVKRYNARSLGHAVKRSLRQSRAERCWQMSTEFQHVGLTVAEPIAMLERRFGPFCGNAYFVSACVDGVELLEWLPQQQEPVQQQVAAEIRQLFSTFLQHRLSHGDMKATNLLWSDQKIVLIDLDAACVHRFSVLARRGYLRDVRRFIRNGECFAEILKSPL